MTWEEIRDDMGMTKKNKVLAVVFTNIALFAILALALTVFYIPSMNIPEQQEYVVVEGKRIYKDNEGYVTFFISFKFSDGSVTEFDEGRDGVSKRKRGLVYNAIQEGETGMLTYKENGRFISFEKDQEYGGGKIKTYQIPEKNAIILLTSAAFITSAIFNILVIFVSKTVYPTRVRAKLLEKGKYIEETEEGSYSIKYATFELADGTRRRLVVPRKKTHNSLRVNETGMLTYVRGLSSDEEKLLEFEYMGEQSPAAE